MKRFLSSVSLVWDEAQLHASFNRSSGIHPKQGTLRKFGVAEHHTGFQKTPCTGQFTPFKLYSLLQAASPGMYAQDGQHQRALDNTGKGGVQLQHHGQLNAADIQTGEKK